MKGTKKGYIQASILTKILSIIAFIAVVSVFYLLFSVMNHNQISFSISSSSNELDVRMMMDNLLATPLIIDGKTVTFKQLVELAQYDKSYSDELKMQAERLLTVAENRFENANKAGILKKHYDCRSVYILRLDEHTTIKSRFHSAHISDAKYYTRSFTLNSYPNTHFEKECITDWHASKDLNPNVAVETRTVTFEDGNEIQLDLIRIMEKIT